MASQKASSLDKDLAFLAGTDANKRHSTKGNAGPKVHIGRVEDQLSAAGVLDHNDPSFDASKGKSQFASGPVSTAIHTIPVTTWGRGRTDIHVGRQSTGQDDASDTASYVLDEVPTAPGRATDTRLQADSRLAARAGILTSEEGAHMGHLLAGSNIGSRCQASPTLLDSSGGGWGASSGITTGSGGPVSHAVAPHSRPVLPLVDFKRRSDAILTEFFTSYDQAEAAQAFCELLESASFFAFEFVYRAIRRALEKSDQEREMVCRLLARLASLGMMGGLATQGGRYGGAHSPPRAEVQQQSSGQGSSSRAPSPSPSPSPPRRAPVHSLTMKAVGQGMERCLECVEDIAVDVPKAREMLARFLARAVADELLPPAYLDDPAIAARAPDICAAARALLAQPHAGERLEHAWSVTGADGIEEMKASVAAAVREYFVSDDVSGPVAAVGEIGTPYFGHEVAYRTLVTAIDHMGSLPAHKPRSGSSSSGGEEELSSPSHRQAVAEHDRGKAQAAVKLLRALRVRGLLTETQALKGVERARDALPDLSADDPRAKEHLALVLALACEGRVLPGTAADMLG